MAGKIAARFWRFSPKIRAASLPSMLTRDVHCRRMLCTSKVSKVSSTMKTTQSAVQPAAATTFEEPAIIDPLSHPDFFGVNDMVNLKELFDARVHLGHKAGCRNETMTPYLFGNRLGVDIFDLEQTVPLLRNALNVTAHIAFREGVILFLTRHLQSLHLVERTAQEAGEYSHCREWKGGSFTNATTQYGAVTRLPDLCIFLCTQNNVFNPHIAITETAKMNIPTIGIVDSSCDPSLITYPIPGNDDTMDSINLYCSLFKEAILRGKAKRKELLDQGYEI